MKCQRAGLTFGMLVALAACGNKLAPLTQQEKQTVNELTANPKTRCVGRYLVDMPEGMYVSGYAKMQGIDIETKAMSHDVYQREIAKREAELKATRSIHGYQSIYSSGEAWGNGIKLTIEGSD